MKPIKVGDRVRALDTSDVGEKFRGLTGTVVDGSKRFYVKFDSPPTGEGWPEDHQGGTWGIENLERLVSVGDRVRVTKAIDGAAYDATGITGTVVEVYSFGVCKYRVSLDARPLGSFDDIDRWGVADVEPLEAEFVQINARPEPISPTVLHQATVIGNLSEEIDKLRAQNARDQATIKYLEGLMTDAQHQRLAGFRDGQDAR